MSNDTERSEWWYHVEPRGVRFPTRHEAIGYACLSEQWDPTPTNLEVGARKAGPSSTGIDR